MAKTKTEAPYAPQRWRHRPTVVEGIIYDGTVECAKAIVEWGRRRTGNTPFRIVGDDLHAVTPQGERYVPQGDMAVLGVIDEPYSVQPEVREKAYVKVVGEDHRAILSGAQVMQLRYSADDITDVGQLREIVAQLGASHEALRVE